MRKFHVLSKMEMKVEKVAYFLKTVITMIVDEKYYKGASCHEKVSSTDGKSGIMRELS